MGKQGTRAELNIRRRHLSVLKSIAGRKKGEQEDELKYRAESSYQGVTLLI
jgi:hypothetical protein